MWGNLNRIFSSYKPEQDIHTHFSYLNLSHKISFWWRSTEFFNFWLHFNLRQSSPVIKIEKFHIFFLCLVLAFYNLLNPFTFSPLASSTHDTTICSWLNFQIPLRIIGNLQFSILKKEKRNEHKTAKFVKFQQEQCLKEWNI